MTTRLVIRWVFAALAVFAIGCFTIVGFVRPNPFFQATMLAAWLIGISWLAATLPYRASALVRRRSVALSGVVILLVAGALPFELDREGAAALAAYLLVWVGLGALTMRVLTGERMRAHLEAWSRLEEVADEPDSVVAEIDALDSVLAEKGPEGLGKPSGRTLEEIAREYGTAHEVFEQTHPKVFQVLALEWWEASPEAQTATEAERAEFEAELAELRREADSAGPISASELASQVERARAAGLPESIPRLMFDFHSTMRSKFEESRAALEPLRDLIDALGEVKGVSATMRAAGPALLALGFIAVWISAVIVLWVADPGAWRGLGNEEVQFGEFIHLAVSSAFGGTPPGIEAASPVARMLLVGELLSGATVLGAYLASIWGAPTIRPDAVSGHPVSPDEEPDSVALVKQMVKAWNRGDKDQVFGGLSEGFDVRDADGTVLASGRDAAKDLLETSGINVVRISVPAQENADREVRIVVTAAAAGSDARATVARVAVIDGKPVGIQLGAPDKGDARRAVADDGGH